MKKNIKGFLWLLPLLIMALIFIVVPFFTGIVEAFKVTEIVDRVNFTIGIENFKNVIASHEFSNAFFYSNLILFLGVPLGLILSFGFALLLNTILNKLFKNLIVTILFSQFFLSSFAVGLAFIYLFDTEKAAFNLIFNTQFQFHEGSNNLIVLLIFHVWRIWPFNTVILLFHFTNQKKKYFNLIKIDDLTIWDQIRNVYFQKMQRLLFLLIYINILEALLLNPIAIYKIETLRINQVSTFSYYIYYYLKISSEPLFGIVGAASVLLLSYLILITLILLSMYFLIIKIKKLHLYLVQKKTFLSWSFKDYKTRH